MEWLVLEVVLGVLLLAVLALITLAARRRWLGRAGSVFECAVLLPGRTPEGRWVLGLARYSGEQVEWFRIFSLSSRPRVRILRRETSMAGTRAPDSRELELLYDEQQVVTLRTGGAPVVLAMGGASVTGLMSWLEAAPPETRYPV